MTSKLANDRPIITLKLATSLDARVATSTGASQWITGPEARAEVHRMRAAHDAVLTGINTILIDNAELTARLNPSAPRQPYRVVLDSSARLPLDGRLVQSKSLGDIIWFTAQSAPPASHRNLTGIHHHQAPPAPNGAVGLDLSQAITLLAQEYHIQTIMVEAGPILASAFLRTGLVDQIAWFRAPLLLGGDGRPAFESLGVEDLSQAWPLELISRETFGRDTLERFDTRPSQRAH